MNLHKRLQQNHVTSQHCYGLSKNEFSKINFCLFFFFLDIDEVFRVLPIPIDNMNPDIINRRKSILDKYIKVKTKPKKNLKKIVSFVATYF